MTSFTGYIYLITNLVNGKLYVGCTRVSIARRWAQHCSAARKGSSLAIHRAIRKYGVDNFKIEVLEVANTIELMLSAEIRWITSHNCIVPNGYNLTMGGEGVDFTVPAVREKLMQGAAKRRNDPEWHKACSKGARLRSANPIWQEHIKEAAKRRSEDVVCQNKLREGVRKRTATPEWRENVAKGARKRGLDPEYRKKCSEAAQRKLNDPQWCEANTAQLKNQHADPEWQKARTEGLKKARAIQTANAIARDAHLPPEEQVKRARRREKNRLSKQIRQADQVKKPHQKP